MATCKDCIHFVVCDSGRHIGEHIDDDGVYTAGVEKMCDGFKNKALTIDLPCPIDHDSLFAIVDLYHRKKIVGQTVAKYDIDCIIIGFSQKPVYRCCNGSNEWIDFDGDEIGKTVFLTIEEAEAELKGVEK